MPSGFELAFTNNGHLQPEESVSFDSGIEQRFFSDRAILDATYFYNRFENQIVVLGGSLTHLSTFTSANLGNSRAEGGEASFRFQPTRSIEAQAQYTLVASSLLALNGANVALSPFHAGQPLLRIPRNSASYNVTWRHGRLMLNSNAYFRGSILDLEPNDGTYACELGLPCLFTNGGYDLVNGGFSYQLPKGLEIYGTLYNLLNQSYEESFGYPALKLNFMAGVRFTFPGK
jgi:vitamin B12 transporter